MNFETWLQQSNPGIPTPSALAVLNLAGEGATVPFIARYRKEKTGGLDEVAIQDVIDQKEKWDTLLRRQSFILEEIGKQGKLTPELKSRIESTFRPEALEDIYLPYRQKRKSKATLAREAGIEPLADWIWNCGHGTESPQPGQTLEIWAFTFRNEEKGFKDAQAALEGAQDILIERLSENEVLRKLVRDTVFEKGEILTAKAQKAKPNSKFENYFSFHEKIQSLLLPQNSHRYLALRRGWIEEELKLELGPPPGPGEAPPQGDASENYEAQLLRAFHSEACTESQSVGAEILGKAARIAFKAHVLPSIENEVHKALKEVADRTAIQVFSENVRKLLLAAPFGPKAVLGVDPGIRTGCKIALVDGSGKFVANTVFQLQTEEGKKSARVLLQEILKNAEIRAIAVGNGTAGRETEIFLRSELKQLGSSVPVVMVSESGASVYSASEAAREEFPDLDLTIRGAISIARRLQDPLAELVKVDPKSIGVGQYQHDVSQPALKRGLDFVVDSCVNQVGVNLNTASYHLLSHVSGIGEALAKAVVEQRGKKGLYSSRQALLDVPRFTQKAFEQAAGFLRVQGSEQPLDETAVHPERYPLIESLASRLGKSVRDLMGSGVALVKQDAKFKEEVGEFTFRDIIAELEKPGRDPREEFVPFQFRDDIHEVKDLQPGMVCPGIVTNVTNFGAFVDIGVHQDGLVHISQLSDRFIKDPRECVSPGDRLQVRVLEVNLEKNQIALSAKAAKPAPAPREKRPRRENPLPRPAGQPREHAQAHAPGPAHRKPIAPVSQKKPVPRKPKEVFNNAFAGLASLRGTLKPKE